MPIFLLLGASMAAIAGLRYKNRCRKVSQREEHLDNTIDDSFPASDPPAYTMGRAY